tara:strand:- start:231 stop:590 length:360 start_codon:yes stop_codon:yes gene_type:complete
MSNYYIRKPGINETSPYQVSGKPFATGSFGTDGSTGTPTVIEFPTVTRWIYIVNAGARPIKYAFHADDLASDYAVVDTGKQSEVLEVRAKEIHLIGAGVSATTDISICAGLTSIATGSL